jgi:hypothetical protein
LTEFKKKLKKDGTYHAPGQYELSAYSDGDVSEWANDPGCINREECASELARRDQARAAADPEIQRLAEEERLSKKRSHLAIDPFDPRTEVSADARHIAGRIVIALWVIFILVPFVLAILFEVLK